MQPDFTLNMARAHAPPPTNVVAHTFIKKHLLTKRVVVTARFQILLSVISMTTVMSIAVAVGEPEVREDSD